LRRELVIGFSRKLVHITVIAPHELQADRKLPYLEGSPEGIPDTS
jgi:hypothetical protein